MKDLFAHKRTSIAGVLIIVGSLGTFFGKWISTKQPPEQAEWGALFVALGAGASSLASADGKNVPPPSAP